MNYICIIIILIKFLQIRTQFCGAFRPDMPSNCTDFSTLAYQCCYIEGDSIVACYGVRAASQVNMNEITIYPPVTLTNMDCGVEPVDMIKKENLCYDLEPSDSNECKQRGGANCCFMQYDNMAFCINKNTFNVKDPKAVLQCRAFKLNMNLLIVMLVLLLNFFL